MISLEKTPFSQNIDLKFENSTLAFRICLLGYDKNKQVNQLVKGKATPTLTGRVKNDLFVSILYYKVTSAILTE